MKSATPPPWNGNRAARRELLNREYLRSFRISLAIVRDVPRAASIAKRVVRQAATMMPRWSDEASAQRWVEHFTVLCSREFRTAGSVTFDTPAAPTSNKTVDSGRTDNSLSALDRALRTLPFQQREAFVLHHGLGMDLRQQATAMDCSNAAAANHLIAAVTSLRAVPGEHLAEFTSALPGMIDQHTPPPQVISLAVDSTLKKGRVRWLLYWFVAWPLVLIGLVTACFFAWTFWKMLIF